jgi:hypothetical protein
MKSPKEKAGGICTHAGPRTSCSHSLIAIPPSSSARELEATERAEVVSEIVALHGEIVTAARTSLDKAIRIGELLAAQKASMKHGQWLPWIKENLPFAEVTAQRYMRCYVRRDELKSVTVTDLGDAYHLLSAPAEPKPVTKDEIPTPAELTDSVESIVSAVHLFCKNELQEVAKTIDGIKGEPANDEERLSWIHSLVACQRKAAKWRHYWSEYTLRCERRLGEGIIKLREMLSADPWPELTKLYPWLMRQKERCPEAAALWDKYPDEMKVLETARAFHVLLTEEAAA